jgi:hypothetical protein
MWLIAEEMLLNVVNVSRVEKRTNHIKTLGSSVTRIEYQIVIHHRDGDGTEFVTTLYFPTEHNRDVGFDRIRRSKEVLGNLSNNIDLTGLGTCKEE